MTAGAAGDLGRRIAEQRRRAGLSIEDAAAAAGMSPEYLSYLETGPEPNASVAALESLALALGVPFGALTGAGMDLAPGRPEAAANPVLTELTAAECRSHLAAGGVGRIVFDEQGRGPVAIPVNFQMDGDDIIFRTDAGSPVERNVQHGRVSFDVDHIDDALAEGWSVLLTGTARVISDDAELRRLADLGIEPWAGGGKGTYVRMIAEQVTGRRIRVAD
jgi:transcriptional regulator with XRE-family HTH domain